MTKLSAAVTVLAVTFGFAVTASRAQPSALIGGGKDLSGHPTDGKEILIKLRHVAQLLAERERNGLLPREQSAVDAAITEEIEELWQTRPTRRSRGTGSITSR